MARGGTNEAELPVTGSRLRETLRYSLRRARGFFAACRDSRVEVGERPSWHPEELVVREFAQNAITWAALQYLGVREGSEITLDFFFETAGPHADHELAEFLTTISGYQAAAESDGVSGRTQPITVSPNALGDWARARLYTCFEHGRCLFAG